MKQRFIKKRNCIDEFTVISNNELLFIKIYDRINIKINTLIGRNNMQFLNVIYVLNFIINIVVENIFENKKLHFDIQYYYFHRNDFVIVYVLRIKNHYVLKDNKKSEEMIAFATFISIDFIHNWHQLLVHVNNKVIQYLTTIIE